MIPQSSELVEGGHTGIIANRYSLGFLYISADSTNTDKINIKVTARGKEFNQAIKISKKLITFGVRRYFQCDCGRMVNSLYLKDGSFKCRHCHDLAYEVTRFRKGSWLYRINRRERIQAAQHQVRNISYKNVYTRKAKMVMELAAKYS
jgi:hypothetical protein